MGYSLSVLFTPTDTATNLQMIDSALKRLLQKLGSNQNAVTMQEKAKRIQDLLLILKMGGTTEDPADDAVLQQIRNDVIKALNIKGGKLFSTNNFSNSYDINAFFKKEISMINNIMFSQSSNIKPIDNSTVNISNLANEIVDNQYAVLKNFLLNSGLINQTSSGAMRRISQRRNRINISGSGGNSVLTINKQYTLTPDLLQVFQDINRYNFTTRTNKQGYYSKLGNGDPYIVYTSILNALGFNQDFIFRSFTRFLACYINAVKGIRDHPQHQKKGSIVLRKMVGLYEITGYGIELGGEIPDFIILNSQSSGIIVYSTAYLINQLYNKTKTNLKFSGNNFGFSKVSVSTKQSNLF